MLLRLKNQRVKKLAIMDQDGANIKYLTLGNELVLTPRFNPTNQMLPICRILGICQEFIYLISRQAHKK